MTDLISTDKQQQQPLSPTTLEALVRTQPSSPLVSRAREKLREIQRAPRGHCTS